MSFAKKIVKRMIDKDFEKPGYEDDELYDTMQRWSKRFKDLAYKWRHIPFIAWSFRGSSEVWSYAHWYYYWKKNNIKGENNGQRNN